MDIFSWLGYATALISYCSLFLIVIIAQKKNLTHRVLILFSALGCLWACLHLTVNLTILPPLWLNWAESIRISAMGLLLFSLLSHQYTQFKQLLTTPTVISIISIAFLIPLATTFKMLTPAWVFIGYLALTVALLILLEIIYRQAKSALWGLKPLILTFGALLIFDFIVFADASLIANINPDMWLARGYLHTLLVPLLLWSIKRSKSLGIQVYVSREMVFQSSLLLAAGVYLCLMAITGYYIKSIQSQWSGMVQIIFVVLAFVILFALFVSDTLKRNIKVFLEKNFFANQFDYRVQWLNLTNLLNLPLDARHSFYDRSLQAFIYSINYNAGILYKVKGSQLETITKHKINNSTVMMNEPLAPMPIQAEFEGDFEAGHKILSLILPYIEQKHWIIDLNDYKKHPSRYPNLSLKDELISACPFHAIVPIYQQDKLWGLVCLNNKADEQLNFNWEIRDYMTVVTTQVGHYIFQHEANQVVTENAQFAAFSRMSAFVIHDLKNVLAQVDMILKNAEKHKHNPEFIDDTFETLGYTKQRMEKMLAQLMNKTLDETQVKNKIKINTLIQEIIDKRCQNLQPTPQISTAENIELALDAEKFSNVLYHLIDNAQHATEDDGKITISVSRRNNHVSISLKDTGCGMSAEFIRDKLFKPFETTKGNAGMGIGAYDARLYIEQIGGHLSVVSTVSQGTEFIIELPLAN